MSGDSQPVDVSVLVPVLNEASHIRETVAAMRAQRFAGTVELLLIDGQSVDGTRAILEELAREDARIRVLDNPQRTIPHALNLGLAAARGTFIARMDAHSWYPPEYLARGVERLRRGDVAWVTGPAIPDGTGRWSRRVALALGSKAGQGGSRKWSTTGGEAAASADEPDEIELDTGVFAGVWPRAALDAHGGWDEGWPVNEDAELAGRFLAAGERIVCLPELGATYLPRDSLVGLARQYWRFGFYRVKTVHRHPHALRRGHVIAPALVLMLIASALARGPIRRLARFGTVAYGLGLAGSSAREHGHADLRDILALPAVLATMHLAWGAGFLAGCLRFGPPLVALAALGRRSAAEPTRAPRASGSA